MTDSSEGWDRPIVSGEVPATEALPESPTTPVRAPIADVPFLPVAGDSDGDGVIDEAPFEIPPSVDQPLADDEAAPALITSVPQVDEDVTPADAALPAETSEDAKPTPWWRLMFGGGKPESADEPHQA